MSLSQKIEEAANKLVASVYEGIEECRKGKDFDRQKVSKAMFVASGALAYLSWQQRNSQENLLEKVVREMVDRFFGKSPTCDEAGCDSGS